MAPALAAEIDRLREINSDLLAALEGIRGHALNALESDGSVFIDETHILNVAENAIAKATQP